MDIVSGSLTGLFSYDVGYEISLDAFAQLVQPIGLQPPSSEARAAGIRGAGRTMDLRGAPCVVRLPERDVEASLVLRAHDFGALTVMLSLPLSGSIDRLGPLTAALVRTRAMESVATTLLRSLLKPAAAAISKASFDGFVEDFYVVQVDRFDRPVTPDELRANYRAPIALALRCEKETLAEGEADEVFETAISYHPRDLVVTDWNAAFLFAADNPPLLDALEFLNVQLVELRFFDRRLDSRMGELFQLVYRKQRLRTLAFNPFGRSLEEVSELKVETTLIAERVGNALKFFDDLYLAKVYTLTAERLHLEAWRGSVETKLRVVQEIFEILNRRAATYRAEALELTIILLIVLEIVLSFRR
ncbi:MAG TPA: hypothetical protein VMT89_15550 [Candidatus Acidoferrales bacterium]|nr:hypothetical protein [Candidatus Acidoferrales bacterium]